MHKYLASILVQFKAQRGCQSIKSSSRSSRGKEKYSNTSKTPKCQEKKLEGMNNTLFNMILQNSVSTVMSLLTEVIVNDLVKL